MTKQTVLITGSSGLVGGCIAQSLCDAYTILTPRRKELDLSDAESIKKYMIHVSPSIVVHAAAFTDNTKAESERGDKSGPCWKVNIDGTKCIVDTAKTMGAFVIYISTGSVFAGDKKHQGPFSEYDAVSPEQSVSWYAWTKSVAESHVVNGAIIRLSHPIQTYSHVSMLAPASPTGGCEYDHFDYLQKILKLYESNSVYPLFTDQLFPLTDLYEMAEAIKKLIVIKKQGIYHIVSSDMTTPYELASYAIEKKFHQKPDLKHISFVEFIQHQPNARRYSQYSGIDGTHTIHQLDLPMYTWRDVVNKGTIVK